ncbi:hypothetical protein [Acinetobacter sp. YH12145]|uniref:hypothetical protein n=1 Tax=Acinetobacter sp. YH12145 TaxID=2601129 RepID=UPI0015D3B3D7|nr:hypothetical protein [Acinetobacter sp. YH12145]
MGQEQPKNPELETDEIIESPIYFVDFSQEFDYLYSNVFTRTKLDLIDDFLDHYEINGLRNWKGKISCSWKVPQHYSDWESRSAFAKHYNLWHAHIGLPTWQSYPNVPFQTSNQVLHFQKIGSFEIKLLTLSTHNPIDLPTLENILDEE